MTNKIIGIHKAFIKRGYNIGSFLKFPLNELKNINSKINQNDIINGKLNGKRKMNLANGIYLEGNFINDKLNGEGQNSLINETKNDTENNNTNNPNLSYGDKYVGELYNNMPYGRGKYFSSNGEIREGNYSLVQKNKFNNKTNEIRLKINIIKDSINKHIYFLDNSKLHDNLTELNKTNTELYINNKKFEYKKYFTPEKKGIYSILLKFNVNITDCSYMFYNCSAIESIEIISFDTSKVTNMSNMFCCCTDLKSISSMTDWNTINTTNMSSMFNSCYFLISLPDISKWNTKNVIDMSEMFYLCRELKSLPDIFNWDITNVINMNKMFYCCISLISLPDFEQKKTTKFVDMRNMFFGCKGLRYCSDISQRKETLEKEGHNLYNANNVDNKIIEIFEKFKKEEINRKDIIRIKSKI